MCTCGKCKYRTKEGGEWICNNPDGENYSLEVERTDSCIDGEEKGSRLKNAERVFTARDITDIWHA